jgi:hypothetical protein
MGNGLLATMLAAVCANAAPAQQQAWAEKMFKDGLVHDFSNQPHGAQLAHSFTITNIYAVQMEIIGCDPGCKCVTAIPAKRILKPREATTIDVTMDARHFTGPKKVTIRVTVGPDFISTAELVVTANSRADIVFNPGHVAFDPVARGATPTRTVDVEYAGKFPWEVSEATTSKDAPFTAEAKSLYRKPDGVGYRVTVTLKANAAPGAFKEFVYLKTNDPNAALLPVLVEGTVQSPLEVSPERFALGTVKVGEALTRRVSVRGSKPFRVVGIEGPAGISLQAEPNAAAQKVQTVALVYQPAQAGPFNHEVKIKTDLQDTPAIVTLEGVAAP